jgi:Cu2+-exporting ATPase
LGESFFWELVTLIDLMLLGHWLEMRNVVAINAQLLRRADLTVEAAVTPR